MPCNEIHETFTHLLRVALSFYRGMYGLGVLAGAGIAVEVLMVGGRDGEVLVGGGRGGGVEILLL